MATILILMPDRPVYTALGMAVGYAAGQLTWKPAGMTPQEHLVACMTGAMLMFAFVLGAQSVWPF